MDIVVLSVAIRKVEEVEHIFIADVRNVATMDSLYQIPFFMELKCQFSHYKLRSTGYDEKR